MGHQRAFELLVMGEPFSAGQAEDAGFVNRVVTSEEVEVKTLAAAAKLASKPREAVKLSRDLVRGDRSDILQRMREEALLFDERLNSDEAKAAFEAFLTREKK